ncbi:acyl-CoA dehydrogenase family protein [Trebonia sp.]|uniref:acyl-CoA dehydrogenase family protein n=1 Tax=Trebonia sp. TaxID=2767075 RepID=UPI002610C361|nr:acyl-CoA dehydrogenase family protein [Trebonia sp.]
MDWQLTAEQRLARETCRRVLEQHCPLSRVRELIGDPVGYDQETWTRGGALGWYGMAVPAEYGGASVSAEPLVDLTIVAEELGRMVHPGPFASTNLVAAALARCGSADLRQRYLPALVTGDVIGTWAGAPGAPGAPGTASITASAAPNGYVLHGISRYVVDAPAVGVLLVTASLSGRPVQFLLPAPAPGVRIEPLECLDLARRTATVSFDGAVADAAAAMCTDHDGRGCVERQLQLALVLQCAETVGVADRGLELTVAYTRDRVAFGRPIGSYQALKHRMAAHRIRLEGAFAVTAYAARAVQHEQPDAAVAVRAAKAFVGKWATTILHDCVQLTGGLGMTWDYDLHLYFRRAISNEQLFGSPDEHCRSLVDLVAGWAA